ncbi:hypothetical protein SAMN04489712_107230 [Thermomonospora echinospora]|uniref:SalK n=1 Tax=Thermomonospora echinospora TaxID=1992 RepID=A0A1H6BLT2_9ACTN|nr:hypothetical protein [Thermomonospora echinospora]SEG61634.1 hypothetical protein SAMN04489712_107230 [Thermomonospora echinospora]
MEPSFARAVWRVMEPVHAVTYFADECVEANRAVGLRGYWMGYFGSRAAPLGPVPAGVVEATFYNFHPAMVRRAIPDAWGFAEPAAILQARAEAAAKALRRLAPGVDEAAAALNPGLAAAIEAADTPGRPLFGANRDLPMPEDPVQALWQAATTLREHRGDGHVALLAAEGLDGCAVHVLLSAAEGVPAELLQRTRAWSAEDWAAAVTRLAERGLVTAEGAVTEAGRALRASIEARTDELAVDPYRVVPDPDGLVALLGALARDVAPAIGFPNPMGLPRPA